MATPLKQSDLTSIFKLCPDNLLDKETFRKLNALSNELGFARKVAFARNVQILHKKSVTTLGIFVVGGDWLA